MSTHPSQPGRGAQALLSLISNDPDLATISCEEAAELLQMSIEYVRKEINRCALPASKHGKCWRIRRTELKKYLVHKEMLARNVDRPQRSEPIKNPAL